MKSLFTNKNFSWKVNLLALVSLVSLSACISDEDDRQYSNAWGYVADITNGIATINTSSGFAINHTLPSTITQGSCLALSFSVKDAHAGGTHQARNLTYALLSTYSPISSTMPSANDTVRLTNISIASYSPTNYYGDNYLLTVDASTYDGLQIEPQFFFDPSSIGSSFSPSSDSIIVNVNLQITGNSTSSVAQYVRGSCTVDLSSIRQAFNTLGTFSQNSIPIYFRYATSSTSTSLTSRVEMTIE